MTTTYPTRMTSRLVGLIKKIFNEQFSGFLPRLLLQVCKLLIMWTEKSKRKVKGIVFVRQLFLPSPRLILTLRGRNLRISLIMNKFQRSLE